MLGIGIAALIVAAIGVGLVVFLHWVKIREVVRTSLSFEAQAGIPESGRLVVSIDHDCHATISFRSVALVFPGGPHCEEGRLSFTLLVGLSAPFKRGEPTRKYALPPQAMERIAKWESLPEKLSVEIESFGGLLHRIEDSEVRAELEKFRKLAERRESPEEQLAREREESQEQHLQDHGWEDFDGNFSGGQR